MARQHAGRAVPGHQQQHQQHQQQHEQHHPGALLDVQPALQRADGDGAHGQVGPADKEPDDGVGAGGVSPRRAADAYAGLGLALPFCLECGLAHAATAGCGNHPVDDEAAKTKKRQLGRVAVAVPQLHACVLCPKTYAKRANLVAHARTHTGERPFRCAACGETFAYKNTLLRHSERHHRKDSTNAGAEPGRDGPYQAPAASAAQQLHISLDAAAKAEQALALLLWTPHFMDPSSSSLLQDAVLAVAGPDGGGAPRKSIDDHVSAAAVTAADAGAGDEGGVDGFVFPCMECGRTHAACAGCDCDDERYACTQCPKAFTNPRSLSKHGRTHAAGPRGLRFRCPACSATYAYQTGLLKHLASTTCSAAYSSTALANGSEEPRSSSTSASSGAASQSTSASGEVALTVKRKHAEVDDVAEPQQKQQQQQQQRRRSTRSSASASARVLARAAVGAVRREPKKDDEDDDDLLRLRGRWAACPQCGKKINPTHLTDHVRTAHTGQQPYACSVCGTTFATAGQHREHFKTHDDLGAVCAKCLLLFPDTAVRHRHYQSEAHKRYNPLAARQQLPPSSSGPAQQ